MNTKIIRDTNKENMFLAGELIKNGGLVAFPTETVYGLGANAYDEKAVKDIYVAKGRPSDNPLIVHIADACDVVKVAREVPENAKKLLDKYAPGPFTLILKKQKNIPDSVTAGLDTVGVRIPSNPIAREFIKASGVPIAAPSANLSGKPSPTKAEHVICDMNGRIDAIICGDEAEIGVESTIIDVTGAVPTILRPGGITLEDVISTCGCGQVDKNVLKGVAKDEQPKCPGMKYKHYAPEADVTVVEGKKEDTERKIAELVISAKNSNKTVGVLAYSEDIFGADLYICEGKNNRDFANRLFDSLREFDNQKIDVVFVQLCLKDSMELAVKNRIYKSAGNKIIYVGENL